MHAVIQLLLIYRCLQKHVIDALGLVSEISTIESVYYSMHFRLLGSRDKQMFLRFIRENLTKYSIFGLFASFLTVLLGMDYLYNKHFNVNSEPDDAMVWAFSVALSAMSFFLLLNFCLYSQGIMQDEVDRMSEAKKKLETALLNNRRSSRKEKGRRK